MENLKLKILAEREENTNGDNKAICYNCEGTLEDYVKSIPDRYKDYDVQRGIVSNVYLDRLTQTILEGRFIPPIVLISTKNEIPSTEINISEYKILDGLQRTYRIKSIYNALMFYIEKREEGINFFGLSKFKLSRIYKQELEENDTTATILLTIIKWVEETNTSLDGLKNIFPYFKQWFEVWTNLEKKEQINKMLVLNAGHKPMDIKHQLELLFLNIMPNNYLSTFVRAKDVNSSFFYNKKERGQLHLSHFISALLSFDNAQPITVDAKYIQSLQNDLDSELDKIKLYFEDENLTALIDFTRALDDLYFKEYGTLGIQWLGRETILVGLFSAFGKYYQYCKDENSLQNCLNKIKDKVSKNISIFDIEKFNEAKTTSIDITKVNIGNIFKYTTFNTMCKLLLHNETNIDWNSTFKFGAKANNDCV